MIFQDLRVGQPLAPLAPPSSAPEGRTSPSPRTPPRASSSPTSSTVVSRSFSDRPWPDATPKTARTGPLRPRRTARSPRPRSGSGSLRPRWFSWMVYSLVDPINRKARGVRHGWRRILCRRRNRGRRGQGDRATVFRECDRLR